MHIKTVIYCTEKELQLLPIKHNILYVVDNGKLYYDLNNERTFLNEDMLLLENNMNIMQQEIIELKNKNNKLERNQQLLIDGISSTIHLLQNMS